MNPLVLPATEADLNEIIGLARSFDLDMEDVTWQQFLLVKHNNRILGFGRLRPYPVCTEIATVGVVPEERNKGIGSALVKELIRIGPNEIFVTCVIPGFFSRLGFEAVKQYPPVLQKKVDFCKCYNFKDEQIFVMRLIK